MDIHHRHGLGVFKVLQEKHNFSYFLHRTSLWGKVYNNTQDGIMGLFQKGLIEVSISPLLITTARYNVCDFTAYTYVTTATVIFRHPQEGLRNVYLTPFQIYVWLSILGTILIATVLIWLSMRFKKKKPRKIVSIARALVMTVGTLCQQGLIENFRKLSMRFILLTLLGFSLIIYQFYSSFIVGSLLTKSPKTLNTLRQLIDSNLEVGIEDISYNHFFFECPPDKITQELYEKKIEKENNFLNVTTGLKLVKKGGFAFHLDTSYGYGVVKKTFDDDEICEMLLFATRPCFPAVAKKSPLKELFTVGIQRLREAGIIDYQNKKFTTKKPKCTTSNTEVKPVDIKQSWSIFIFLALAIAVSFVLLIGEMFYFKFIQK